MKKRFRPEQIIGILKEGQGEGTAREVCARHNVSEPTYSRWKRVYGGMEVAVERPHPSLVHHLQFSQGGVTMCLTDPKRREFRFETSLLFFEDPSLHVS